MVLKIITEGLPSELMNQLLPNEDIHYFSFISYKGGCFSSSSRDEHWIAVSNKRLIYKAKVVDQSHTVEKEGTLPFDKISFIEVNDITSHGCGGCNNTKSFVISVSTSGGKISLPVLTKEKGNEVRAVYQEIQEFFKSQN